MVLNPQAKIVSASQKGEDGKPQQLLPLKTVRPQRTEMYREQFEDQPSELRSLLPVCSRFVGENGLQLCTGLIHLPSRNPLARERIRAPHRATHHRLAARNDLGSRLLLLLLAPISKLPRLCASKKSFTNVDGSFEAFESTSTSRPIQIVSDPNDYPSRRRHRE